MPPAGFELTNPASELPQTYALDRATTGISVVNIPPVICITACYKWVYCQYEWPYFIKEFVVQNANMQRTEDECITGQDLYSKPTFLAK
jgi:hypothetical protein